MVKVPLFFVALVLPLSVNCFIIDSFITAPETVKTIDLNKYLGRWYQMFASQSVVTFWESDAYCVTADYELLPGGKKVSVLNSERLHNATGPLKIINGSASLTNEPGKLSVVLNNVPIAAPYWILKLGPTYGDKSQYEYAIVSDNVEATLFVLARDPDRFNNLYRAEVVNFLDTHGFKRFYNKAVDTYHGKDCVYNTNHH